MGSSFDPIAKANRRLTANDTENPLDLDFEFPSDEIVHLRQAFDALGRHRFGGLWTNNMVDVVRLGERKANPDELARGKWALKALVQCVENGWLPLIYFVDGRRVIYFGNADGLSLHALYPQPENDGEGQIELIGGDIFPCKVHIGKFAEILSDKFGVRSTHKRGPVRQYGPVDEALKEYFQQNPTAKTNSEVYHELAKQMPGLIWPGRTVRNERINDARIAAQKMGLQLTPVTTPDGSQ